jgi:hypothetical protein
MNTEGACGSAVSGRTTLQTGRYSVRFPMKSIEFSNDLILAATLGPWVDSASERDEYQESSWVYRTVGAHGSPQGHLKSNSLDNVGEVQGLLDGNLYLLPSSLRRIETGGLMTQFWYNRYPEI